MDRDRLQTLADARAAENARLREALLTPDERKGVVWAIRVGLAHDDGFSFPRDQNRAILRAALKKLGLPDA